MKKLYALTGVLLIAVMLSSIGFAAADLAYWPFLEIPEQTKGIIWYFATDIDGDGVNEFSGRDVVKSSIVCDWWDNLGNLGTIDPVLILRTNNYVVFVFCPRDLPDGADGTSVTGMLKNGDEFLASGPGFTYRTK